MFRRRSGRPIVRTGVPDERATVCVRPCRRCRIRSVCGLHTYTGDSHRPSDARYEGHDFRIQQVLELVLVQIKVCIACASASPARGRGLCVKRLTVELKVLRIKGGDSGLVLWVVLYGARVIASVSAWIARGMRRTHVGCEVWVLEGLVHGQSFLRVECLRDANEQLSEHEGVGTNQRLGQEVQRLRGRLREHGAEGFPLLDGQRADVISRSSRGDTVELLQSRRACQRRAFHEM